MNRAKVFPLQIYYQSLDEAGESLEIIVKIFFFFMCIQKEAIIFSKGSLQKTKEKMAC